MELDMCLFESTPSRVGGIYNEFVESPRIDNLSSTWAAFEALTTILPKDTSDICVAIGFDHEEVGSLSPVGADSCVLSTWLKRIMSTIEDTSEETFAMMLCHSFLISADAAHGVHPNYAAKHHSEHKPTFNKGVVVKYNGNQRYSTDAASSSIIHKIAADCNIPLQTIMNRNDVPCGSTIGPISSAKLGIRTVDLGIPQLAMHSCRELCGAEDLAHIFNLFVATYKNFRSVDEGMSAL
eukprot:GHVL01032931.1.p1 GENE.GHVL01032931.1~~GHVL01032931.1.p1  ORF type:complete len:238 (+),score=26.87 GHVL01032931.1:131-844(+)